MLEESSRAEEPEASRQPPWFVYMIECLDGSIYTGIARDVMARYAAHVQGKGARYTRAHPPTRLLVTLEYPDRSSALRAEYRIKQLRPAAKRRFVEEFSAATTKLMASETVECIPKNRSES